MKKINKPIFILSTVFFLLLLITSFMAAGGEEEGTLTKDSALYFLVRIFYILRFPTHTLLWGLIIKGGLGAFFLGFIINCMFYGFLLERLVFIFKKKKTLKVDAK